ncbi:MAG: hypothetical protein HQ542_08045, partial [Bacteroidia bacterium]|nr:hypothetical protein [Bacteroidia bacterium]
MKGFLYIGLVFAIFFPIDALFAQLSVVNGSALNMTPIQLVQEWLIGENVIVSDVTYNGSSAVISSNDIGSFTTAGTAALELGLDSGIIMTSGQAAFAVGPNNACGQTGSNGGPNDPDLDILAGGNTHDRAVLEFDFVPMYDTLQFRYVFSSEEFYHYCASSYNDCFGFFLSGPGISGPFSNNSVNIALMPGSTEYVTINNLCNDSTSNWCNAPLVCIPINPCPSCSNCTNPLGNGLNIQYNGLTYIFTAWHIVQPCSTYHIKLAIADVADFSLDSGVFLEKNSFNATGLQVYNTFSIPSITQGAIEGCNDAIISFELLWPTTTPYPIPLTIGGTATNGVDYAFLNDTIFVPAGEDSTALVLHPFDDGIPEGSETFTLIARMPGCYQFIFLYDTIMIFDKTPLLLSAGNDTSVCNGEPVVLAASASGGQIPYQYLWNTGSQQQTDTVFPPTGNYLYHVTLTDACSDSIADSLNVTVSPVPLIMNDTLPDTICSGATTTIILLSNLPGSTFSWTATSNSSSVSGYTNGTGDMIEQILTNSGTTNDTVTYVVYASLDGCVSPPVTLHVIVVADPDAYALPPDTTICSGQSILITNLSSSPGTQFIWNFSTNSTNITGAGNGTGDTINQTLFNT